jgi:integrase
MEPMPKPRYQYVQKQTTRHGKIAWYFRIGDGPRTRMRGKYGDDEFVAMWKSLMSGAAIEKQPAGKHTFEWLVSKYEASADFKLLKKSTQRFRSNVLKTVCKTGGKLLVANVTRQIIAAGRDRRAATPFAAINYLKIMNYLFDWAVDAEYATFNPARDVKRPKAKSEGHTPWTEEDVIAFYKQHPAGSQARLAMEILLFTGLRRSDAYLIGPQHVRDDVIEFRATKNDEQLFIALHPILKASLARVRPGHMAYLVTPVQGQPFRSAASFGNWFGKVCREAGVAGRAHGIRKSLAQRLAERGGSNQELKALFGWTSDAMATLYTKKADRRKMAMSAAAKLNENILSPHLEPTPPHPEKG